MIPLPPPAPHLPDPYSSLFPSRKFRGTGDPHSLGAGAWGLGPGPGEAGAALGRAVEDGCILGALDSGVRSPARLSPALGAPCKLFWSRTSWTRSRGSPRTGSGLGDPAQECVNGCFALAEKRASRSAWACSPAGGEGQSRCAHLLFPSPRTPQRLSSRSPRAGPVCRRGPGRSGRSWISSDWKAVASQSEPGPDPPRCGQRRRVRRLSGTRTRDPLSPRTHAPLLPAPQRPVGAPTPSPAPRAHPTTECACCRVSCPPRGAQGAPPELAEAL